MVCEDFPENLRENLQQQLGNILNSLNVIKSSKNEIALGVNVDANNHLITFSRTEIESQFERLPRLDYFESLPLTCDEKAFFETLIMKIKNISLSSQHSFYKIKNITKQQLLNRIKLLKIEYLQNQNEIFELEGRLSSIIDNDLKEELKNIKNFEKAKR
jgi:hypothetical protein